MANKLNIDIPKSNCFEDIPWSEMQYDSNVYLVSRGMYAGQYAVWDSETGENMIFFGKDSIQVMTGDFLSIEHRDDDGVYFRKTELSLNVFFQ